MKSVQKLQKDNYTLIVHRLTEKMAKFHKMAKCVFSWPTHFKNGQIFRHWPFHGQSGGPATKYGNAGGSLCQS